MIQVKKVIIKKKILNQIMKIDKTFYKDFDYENNKNWYYERYMGNPFTLLYLNKKLIGYYCVISISKSLFNEIKKGNYSEDYDFSLDQINKQNSNYFYIPSVVVLENYRQYSIPLILDLKRTINSLDNVVSIAISKAGMRMCSHFMKQSAKVKGYKIFVKEVNN